MKRHLLVTACALLTLLLAGCSDDGFDPGVEGDAGGPCAESETRCVGESRQQCQNGSFVEVERCGGADVCSAQLGCVACDPAAGDTCSGANVHACDPDGTIGALVEECWTDPCQGGRCGKAGCSAESQLIYVVDDQYRLLSFSPADDAHTFELIGKLECPAGASLPGWGSFGPATPFSMAVDRGARAWVLYTSGEIFWVDAKSGSCTGKSPYPPGKGGFELFGMGFVSDASGSEEEKLFIYGGAAGEQGSGKLAVVDPTSFDLTPLGSLGQDKNPELTGTGKAGLFGFFPGGPFVAEIDKQSGQIKHQWPLPPLGEVRAWAFAHWGGRFYIFVTIAELFSERSQVLRLDPTSGQADTVLSDTPYAIVGAGVSTCAPVIR